MDAREKYAVALYKHFADRYTLLILAGTYQRECTAQELAEQYNIPIAVCYRRIKALEKIGLIRCTGRALTNKGKRVNLYKSMVKAVHLHFNGSELTLRLEPLVDPTLPYESLEPFELTIKIKQ